MQFQCMFHKLTPVGVPCPRCAVINKWNEESPYEHLLELEELEAFHKQCDGNVTDDQFVTYDQLASATFPGYYRVRLCIRDLELLDFVTDADIDCVRATRLEF